jgi:hypothetical protein
MSPDAIKALPVSTINAILFQNHVRPGAGVIEKTELVERVLTMIEDERQERARDEARRAEEEEEQRLLAEAARERTTASVEQRANPVAEQPASTSPAVDEDGDVSMEAADEPHPDVAVSDDATKPPTTLPDIVPKVEVKPIPPKAQAMAAHLERTGLCVICQVSGLRKRR